jgi:NDP-sugar pyrophosphorylase family protein
MQIIIPAAGRGSRFNESEYNEPKPIISWKGKPMIEHVIDNFNHKDDQILIIKQKAHNFTHDDVKIFDIDYITEGPASTAYLVKDFIDMEDELIITNCDQVIQDWNRELFLSHARKYDALLGCFISTHNKNSYVKVNEENLVTEVKEKQVISNIATNGLHYWKKAKYFFDSVEEMQKRNDRTNGEFYVAPSYNYILEKNMQVGIYIFNQHHPIGTPEDLNKYLNLYGTV